ncbi:MAG: hypothetical protein RL238_3397 [Actinomycetota bacterium]
MNRIARFLLPAAAFVGLGVVGVFAARAIVGTDDAAVEIATDDALVRLGADTTTTLADGDTVTVSDLAVTPDHAIPVIAPAAVGLSPDDTEPGRLIEEATAPPDGVPFAAAGGSGAAPEVIGAIVAEVPAGEAVPPPDTTSPPADPTEPVPFDREAWFVLHPDVLGLEWLRDLAFDPCAGATPGSAPADDCAPGYAATFDGALGPTPPRPFMFVNAGHWPTGRTPGVRGCPSAPPSSDTTAEMMMTTHTPLAEAHFRYRPYGSTEAWVEYDIGATPDSEVAWWNEQLAGPAFDVIDSMLMTCFNVDHDPTIPYEYEAWGVDVYGRPVQQDAQPRILAADDPTLRPVATAEITGLSPVAHVKAWSPREGFVSFRWRYVTEGDSFSCDTAQRMPDSMLVGPIGGPTPPELFDLTYSRGFGAAVPMLAGQGVLVCADIHVDDNPLRTAFTDRLLLHAPSQEQPRIVLQSVRRAGDATIPAGIGVSAGDHVTTGTFGECDGGTVVPELAPGRTHTIETVVWECARAVVPVDRDGNLTVPLRVSRRLDPTSEASRRTIEVAIPIHVTGCRVPEGCQGREWFEVPIPVERGGLCGSSFGLGCETPNDGILVFRVDYPVVAGPGGPAGLVTPLEATIPELPDVPVVAPVSYNVLRGSDDFHAGLEATVRTDRPVQITMVPIESPYNDELSQCSTATAVTSTGFSEASTVRFDDLCRGRYYGFELQMVTEDGARFVRDHTEPGTTLFYRLSNASARTTVALQMLGGEGLADLGYFYGITVRLSGVQQTNYWWESTTTRQGTSESCLALNGTTFTPNGPTSAPYYPDEMLVEVSVEITTTGNGDCSGNARTGLGVVSFTSTLTPEQILAGETIVITSPEDSRLRMQVRVSFGDWRPAEPDGYR